MNSLESIVVPLDLARELAEAGFPQTSALVWIEAKTYPNGATMPTHVQPYGCGLPVCAAPTFEEVWAQLPPSISLRPVNEPGKGTFFRCLDSSDKVPYAARFRTAFAYVLPLGPRGVAQFEHKERPVIAAARLWLALVRAGHITPEPQTEDR